ncbi:hypothetical protein [Shewanella algae]|uniref:hypothetical protein n=1 Tax=Shewanella algae TaxID=38313 RepID=UPI0031F596F2
MELNTSDSLAMGFLSICTAGDGLQLSWQLKPAAKPKVIGEFLPEAMIAAVPAA